MRGGKGSDAIALTLSVAAIVVCFGVLIASLVALRDANSASGTALRTSVVSEGEAIEIVRSGPWPDSGTPVLGASLRWVRSPAPGIPYGWCWVVAVVPVPRAPLGRTGHGTDFLPDPRYLTETVLVDRASGSILQTTVDYHPR